MVGLSSLFFSYLHTLFEFTNVGHIPLDELPDYHDGQLFTSFDAYSVSKLATLMFAYELQRRFDKHGVRMTSNAVHPVISTEEFNS